MKTVYTSCRKCFKLSEVKGPREKALCEHCGNALYAVPANTVQMNMGVFRDKPTLAAVLDTTTKQW